MKEHITKTLLIPHVSVFFIVLGLLLQPFDVFLEGYKTILLSESILLTDYVAIGGEGPALFNSGSLMLLSYFIVRKLQVDVTGSIFAGIFTIGGFAFFGKNLINVSIIYIGVYLYALYRRNSVRNVIVVFLFATGISPISSVIMFGMGLPLLYAIPLGIIFGIMSGFMLVELASHAITFHQGYDLYNVGFASGIITFVYFSIFKLSGAQYQTNLIYTNDSHLLLLYLFIGVAVLYLIAGLYVNDFSFKGYKDILKKSGRAVTDFTRRSQHGIALFNVGITSITALIVILLLGIHINGPILGGLFTILGFSTFGKHIRNILPPMIGVVLMVVIFNLDLSISVILAVLFSTALAPIAGEFGLFVGIAAGMLHLPIVTSLGQLHGGVLLYANGFAAAFTAVIITTIITSLKRREEIWRYTKK